MNEDKVTILVDEYERLLDIEKKVRVAREIEEAWSDAINGAIQDLIEERYSDELLEADITIVIKEREEGIKTFTTTGVAKDEDVDYLIERVYQRHAEREAEILDRAGML